MRPNEFCLTSLIVDSVYLDRVVFRCTEHSNYTQFIVFESNSDSSGCCGSSVSLKPAWVEVTIRYKGALHVIDKSLLYDVHLKHVGMLESANANLYRIKSVTPRSTEGGARRDEEDPPCPDREELRDMIAGYMKETRSVFESFMDGIESPPSTISKCDTLIGVIEFLKKNNMYN